MPRQSIERAELSAWNILPIIGAIDPAWNDIVERLSREDLFVVAKANLALQEAQLKAQLEFLGKLNEVMQKYG